ncbi:MAG: GGDEF domain-containing protein [Gammaproteobacteria bacterium]|nr:GGDEF domain-containing protein [Gammaproteobacteria bacterium]
MTEHQGISIAVLTRNQDDVEVINGTLRDAGQAAHCQWIANPQQFADALHSGSIELILLNGGGYCDSVRQIVKQKDAFLPELPIIVYSSKVSEAAIQSVMRDGAVDLVSLQNRSRLRAVVLRELRAFRVEKALNSTLNSATVYRRQLQDFMQGSTFAIALVQEGIVAEINESWLKLFEARKRSDFVGLPIMDNFEAESHAAIKGAIVATSKGKWRRGEKLAVKPRSTHGQAQSLELEFQLTEHDGSDCVQIKIGKPKRKTEEPTKLVHDALKRDPTTLLFHRTQFLERMVKRLKRKPKSGTHVLTFIKIDDFSEVKNKVGVVASEDVIALLAEEIRKRLHPRDVAGRFEGTVIMALLERGSDRDGKVWAQQLVDYVNGLTFRIGQQELAVTCTVGVCGVSGAYSSLDELVTAAANAHQQGKKKGGNTAVLEESTDVDTRMRRYDKIWVKRIKAALMENRFRLAQLPIAGLRNDSIEMCDMLVRMIDEQNNAVLPSEFLPAAERNNLMKTLDRWIITASARFCDNNSADRVFVRLSRQSIQDPSLTDWMKQEFARQTFEPTRMCLQIPEQDAAKFIKQTKFTADRLRDIGVAFAIEHYGVDQNRLQILDILKPDYIKINGELMHSLTTDTNMQDSVRTVCQAAEQRRIETIAERVENANAMAVLFQLGVHYMQGHYVHEPEVVLQETIDVAPTTLEAIGTR